MEESGIGKNKEEILKILRSLEERERTEPSVFKAIEGKRENPAPPANPQDKELKEKLAELEHALMQEKERTLKAEILLTERENARLEMENMFKTMKEQLRFERMGQELDEERKISRARIESLEKQLEEADRRYSEAMNERAKAALQTVSKDIYEQALRMGKTFEDSEKQLRETLNKKEGEYESFKTGHETARKEQEKIWSEQHEKLKAQKDDIIENLKAGHEAARNEIEKNWSGKYENLKVKMDEELEKLKESFGTVKQELERNISEKYAGQIAQLESTMTEARNRIGELSAYEAIVARMKTEKQDFINQIESLKNDLKNQDEALVHLHIRTKEAEYMKGLLEAKAAKLEEAVEARNQKCAEAAGRADFLFAQNAFLQEKVKELSGEALAFEHDAKLARLEAEGLLNKAEDLESICREHEIFKKKINSQNLPFMDLYEEEKRNAKAERMKYEARVRALEEEVKRFTSSHR